MDANGLPSNLPANGNPYTYYFAAIYNNYYQTPDTRPTAGFPARLITLFSINLSILVFAIIYLGILILEAKRKNHLSKLWLFRLVQRPSGRYIATNQNLWSAVMMILLSSFIMGQINDGYRIYVLFLPQTHSASWRCLSFLPLPIYAYLVSSSVFQSFLLTQPEDKEWLSARAANTIFIVAGGIMTVGLFVSAILASVTGDYFWTQGLTAMQRLTVLEASWNGLALSQTALQEVIGLFEPYNNSQNVFSTALYAQMSFLAVVPIYSAILNFASIALARLIRRQININYKQFEEIALNKGEKSTTSQVSEGAVSTESSDSGWKNWAARRDSNDSNKVSWIRRPSLAPSSWSRRSSTSTALPTRSQIRKIARDEENALEAESAKKIMILQKSERDLLLNAFLLLVISVGCSGVVIWMASALQVGEQYMNDWVSNELSIWGFEWIYSVVGNIVLLSLIYNQYNNLTLKIPSSEQAASEQAASEVAASVGGERKTSSTTMFTAERKTSSSTTFSLQDMFGSTGDVTAERKTSSSTTFSLQDMFGARGDGEADRYTVDSRRPTLAPIVEPLEVVVEVEVEVEVDDGEVKQV